MVRTADSQSANTGSIPVTAANEKEPLWLFFIGLCVARELNPQGEALSGFSASLAKAEATCGNDWLSAGQTPQVRKPSNARRSKTIPVTAANKLNIFIFFIDFYIGAVGN